MVRVTDANQLSAQTVTNRTIISVATTGHQGMCRQAPALALQHRFQTLDFLLILSQQCIL